VKKILAIFLFIIYASAAFGTVVNFHYCGKNLIEIYFTEFGVVKNCSCDTENEPKDCCNNTLLFQKADNHNAAETLLVPHASLFYITALPLLNNDVFVEAYNCKKVLSDSSPLCPPGPIYLLNRTLRI